MPLTLALAGLLAGLAGSGVSIGESIASAVGGQPSPTAPTAPASPKPPDANALLQRRQQIGSADSNTQAQTSGTAGDFYRLIMDQLNSGTLGQPGSQGAAQQTVFTPANSQPTNAAVSGQPANLSDFINGFSG